MNLKPGPGGAELVWVGLGWTGVDLAGSECFCANDNGCVGVWKQRESDPRSWVTWWPSLFVLAWVTCARTTPTYERHSCTFPYVLEVRHSVAITVSIHMRLITEGQSCSDEDLRGPTVVVRLGSGLNVKFGVLMAMSKPRLSFLSWRLR